MIFSGLAAIGLLASGYGISNAASSTGTGSSAPTAATSDTNAANDATETTGVDHSNHDAAHEAAETPERAAAEASGAEPGGPGQDGSSGGDSSEAKIAGSITALDTSSQTEAAETATLTALATTTPADASAAAIAAVPGTAATPELNSEDGFVVYKVVVTTATGDIEVTVDAGNGKVLAYLNAHAEIFRQEFRDSTIVIRCYLPKHLLHYIQHPDVTVRMLEVGETAKQVGEAVL